MAKPLPMADHTALFADNRMRVKTILENKFKMRAKKLALWNFFLTQETEAGTFFLVTVPDNDIYIILGLTSTTIQLPAYGRGGMEFLAYLYSRYGLSEREDTTKFLYDTVRLHTISHGDRVEMRRFAAYNLKTKNTYISAYDGNLWKLDGTTPVKCANGEDGVFFADDDGGIPTEVDIAPHGELLKMMTELNFAPVSPGGMTPIHQQRALIVWFLSMAFPDLMPTKPILIIEGAPGSGKSSAAQLLQLALFGVKRPIILSAKREDDFGIILLRAPFCVIDNVDTFIEWLPDAICAYATSGEWTRRRLYTDNEQVTIRPHAFIAVASKNPASFRREDTADRSIVLRLERRKKFQQQRTLEARTLERRSKLLGEYLWYANQMVKILRETSLDEEVEENNRMADFAGMARIVGRVLGWDPDEVTDLLQSLQSERNAFINEGDSLGEILKKWLEYRPKNCPSNQWRRVPINVLFAELDMIAQANSLTFYRTAQILSQKLRSPHLEADFQIVTLNSDGHQEYEIALRGTPKLSSVPLSKILTEEPD